MVKAYGEQVIIEMDKEDFVEQNGILIPTKEKIREFMKKKDRYTIDEKFDNHIRHGVVISRGPRSRRDSLGLKDGDTVIFNRHNGTEFQYEGKKYISLHWQDIPCVYRK